jgi:catechol 2,3-dioxygenase-like lactoylglutathione lyase family enzyme
VNITPTVVIDRIALVVSNLDQAQADYVTSLGCTVEHRDDIEPALTQTLCVPPARGQRACLRLGRQRIELLEFTDAAGRPYPPNSSSSDLWFQHIAIIVNDMTAAHQRVAANPEFRPISRNGPVRLPENSGGVTAFKFRDRDGHPLELLAFPDENVPEEWQTATPASTFLGADHTAIAISDTVRSTDFFTSVFGFRVGARTENRGPEQDDLDDVDDVEVSVTRLGPDLPAPRLELLHYRVGSRRPIPPATASNDIVATHSVLQVPSLDETAAALSRWDRPLVDEDRMMLDHDIPAALIWGPDGHRFLVKEQQETTSRAARDDHIPCP